MAKAKLPYLGTLLCLLLCLIPCAFGAVENGGIPPFSAISDASQYESVNLYNLNVLVKIPVRVKAQVSGNFSMSLVGNNGFSTFLKLDGTTIWHLSGAANNQNVPLQAFATPRPTGGLVGYTATVGVACPGGGTTQTYTNFFFYDQLGTLHSFPGIKVDYPAHCFGSLATVPEQGGYTIHVSTATSAPPATTTTITDNYGGTMASTSTATGSYTDANGNVVSMSNAGGTATYTDNFGLTPITMTPINSPTTFTWVDGNGSNRSATLTYTAVTQKTLNSCPTISEIAGVAHSFPTSLSLPDGTSFGFTYEPTPGTPADVTGRFASITLPTGGTVSYAYSGGASGHGINCVDFTGAVVKRTTSDGTWTYTHTPGTGLASTTTVVDPAGNTTVYSFYNGYVTNKDVHQGGTGGPLLVTVNTCYNGCTSNPVAPILQKDEFITLLGMTTHVQNETKYDLYGNVTANKIWNYGNTGTPDFDNEIVYGSWNGSACVAIGSNIVGLPCGNTLSSLAGVEVHNIVSYDVHGNALSLQSQTGTTWLTKQFTYNSFGQPLTYTDVNGTVTNIGYGNCSGKRISTASVTALSLTRSYTWNCDGAVLTSAMDYNGQSDSTAYADPTWRPSSFTAKDGAVRNMTYTGNSVDSALLFSGATTDHLTTFDGLGRVIVRQRGKAPRDTLNKHCF
jgi:hypothetical protein